MMAAVQRAPTAAALWALKECLVSRRLTHVYMQSVVHQMRAPKHRAQRVANHLS